MATADLVRVVEQVWEAIRGEHVDVPEVVVTLGAGSTGRGGGLTFGHFAPTRWVRGEGEEVHELFLGGEGLERGPVGVMGTLLHEAAHGIAATRDIQDTSRQGRYHNRRFEALAHEVGINVEHSKDRGYSSTTVPIGTELRYEEQISQLEGVMSAYRRSEREARGGVGGEDPGSSNNGVALVCGCERRVRASNSVADAGPIICGICGTPFEISSPGESAS